MYISQLGSIVANTHTTMQTRKEIDLQLHSRVHYGVGQNQKGKVRGYNNQCGKLHYPAMAIRR